MRLIALSLVLSAVAASAATTPEAARYGAENTFLSVPKFSFHLSPRVSAKSGQQNGAPVFEVLDPKPREVSILRRRGSPVGSVSLPALLDHHRDLINKTLGRKNYDISVAGDAGFKKYFLTFQQAGSLLITPLGDLNRLRGEGIDVTIEPGVVYNFKANINIFNPVRGSTLEIHATKGTQGPSHDIKTGTILDLVKAKSYVFNGAGNEYWVLHGTDVDPDTNKLTDTKSLLFIHEAGMSTKAWPVAEASLPAGKAVTVSFGDDQFVLTRSAEGRLTIEEAN